MLSFFIGYLLIFCTVLCGPALFAYMSLTDYLEYGRRIDLFIFSIMLFMCVVFGSLVVCTMLGIL